MHEDQGLGDDEAEEDFVKHSKLREGEEKDACRQHDAVLDRLCFALLSLALAALKQGETTIHKLKELV